MRSVDVLLQEPIRIGTIIFRSLFPFSGESASRGAVR